MFIFFWIICAVIAAGVGSNKGMAGSGFLLGLIFGPIGIIIVLLSSGDKKICPYCKEMVHKDAVRCPSVRRIWSKRNWRKRNNLDSLKGFVVVPVEIERIIERVKSAHYHI